jgi:EAL domain-containing protein (putative c-di-GMP-specific phosphodiesterase class I)
MPLNKKLTPDLSHELRTPLTAIQGALELLTSGAFGDLSAEGLRMVEIATNNAERLLQLTRILEQEYSANDLISPADLARLHLERDLRHAIKRQQLQVYYQPIVDLTNRRVTGFEALLRWQHPSFGMICPDHFIALAEETGLIIPIGLWILHEVCLQLHQWRQQHPLLFQSVTMSVNVSSKQLCDPEFGLQVAQALERTQIPPQDLRLEVTESGMMDNLDLATLMLKELQTLGVQIYIDDFGTGYSCLSRLHELPLDVLKIDRAFVMKMDTQGGEQMIHMITGLAQSLGAKIIAEGIETPEQHHKLQTMGCDRGQGYLFAKPLPKDNVVAFVYEHSHHCQ